jgi:hypothetical protein
MLKKTLLALVVASSLLLVLLTVMSATPSKWSIALCVVILSILAVVSFGWCCDKLTVRRSL